MTRIILYPFLINYLCCLRSRSPVVFGRNGNIGVKKLPRQDGKVPFHPKHSRRPSLLTHPLTVYRTQCQRVIHTHTILPLIENRILQCLNTLIDHLQTSMPILGKCRARTLHLFIPNRTGMTSRTLHGTCHSRQTIPCNILSLRMEGTIAIIHITVRDQIKACRLTLLQLVTARWHLRSRTTL